MIKISKGNEKKYKFHVNRCNSCNSKKDLVVIDITTDRGNSGQIIILCQNCLDKLKQKI